jgi:hypothetical protein
MFTASSAERQQMNLRRERAKLEAQGLRICGIDCDENSPGLLTDKCLSR